MRVVLLFALLLIGYSSFSQSAGLMPDVTKRPVMNAILIEKDPVIDGEILGEEVWSKIQPVSEMWQTKPNAGQPASEKTEIRIAYTASNFYLSVVCYDAQPNKLVVSDARRMLHSIIPIAFYLFSILFTTDRMDSYSEPIQSA